MPLECETLKPQHMEIYSLQKEIFVQQEASFVSFTVIIPVVWILTLSCMRENPDGFVSMWETTPAQKRLHWQTTNPAHPTKSTSTFWLPSKHLKWRTFPTPTCSSLSLVLWKRWMTTSECIKGQFHNYWQIEESLMPALSVLIPGTPSILHYILWHFVVTEVTLNSGFFSQGHFVSGNDIIFIFLYVESFS